MILIRPLIKWRQIRKLVESTQSHALKINSRVQMLAETVLAETVLTYFGRMTNDDHTDG